MTYGSSSMAQFFPNLPNLPLPAESVTGMIRSGRTQSLSTKRLSFPLLIGTLALPFRAVSSLTKFETCVRISVIHH